MASLFGDSKLLKADGKLVPATEVLDGKEYILIYFSAHWCPPCRMFTPRLVEWYKERHSRQNFEVIFVSSDHNQSAFDEYFHEMPWVALPYDNRSLKTELGVKFKIQGIPSLLVFTPDGTLITDKGRAGVAEAPDDIPWRPMFAQSASIFTVLESATTFTSRAGEMMPPSVLRSRHRWALYFSASWCGPCKAFTPVLANFYEKVKAQGKDFEVVFISSDRSEDAWKEYLALHPWKALPFSDPRVRHIKDWLDDKFEVAGIPTLIIFDEHGDVLHRNGRKVVLSDPEGAQYPWPLRPWTSLSDAADFFEDFPVLVGFTDAVDETTGAAVVEQVTARIGSIAERYFAGGKPSPLIRFAHGAAGDQTVGRLREFLGLSSRKDVDVSSGDSALFAIVDLPKIRKSVWGRGGIPSESELGQWVESYLEGKAEMMDARESIDPEVQAEKLRLKEKIAALPAEVTVAQHPHPLRKLSAAETRYSCDICGASINDVTYHCDDCDFDAHPKCAGLN